VSLRPGFVVDERYELAVRLGQGGQGSVWKALDRSTKKLRALKIVDLGDGDEEAAQRAHREADVVCGLEHPSLVDCHSAVKIPAERRLVLVFDFVEATPLSEARTDARLGRVHWLAALRHIAGALAHLHRHGVVHRDLKPDNILVTPEFRDDPAAPGSLKIIDFGIAAPRRGPEGATLSGRFGTPAYMAPELFASPGLEDQRSPARDVFAFGVIAWELLEGSHPAGLPRGSSMSAFAASYQALRSGRSPWPPHVPQGAWGTAISACLALDPALRPADGAAILALLGDPSQAPRALEVAERRSRPSRSPDLAGPTDSHAAPRGVSVREPTVPSAPSKGVLSTERAVASSLPRASAVERTTPMPPEVVVVVPPPKAPAEPSKAPSEVVSRRSAAPASEGSGVWPWILVALVLAAVAAAIANAIPDDSPPRSATTSASTGVSAAPTLPPPTALPADASAPDASSSDASVPIPVPIGACCREGPSCSSGRECERGDCNAYIPAREFVLRIVGLSEKEDFYDTSYRRDLAKHHPPDTQICVSTGKSNEKCTTMGRVASRNGGRLEGLQISVSDFINGNIKLRIKDKKRAHDLRTLEKVTGLQTGGLCTGWKLEDTKEELEVSIHLDDLPTTP
jgi:serine/threonine protein kinase